MATPEEIRKRREALEAQLMGGAVPPIGVYYDEFGIPKVSTTPKFYTDVVVPGYDLSIPGINTKEATAAQLAGLRAEEKRLELEAIGMGSSFDYDKEFKNQLDLVKRDYLEVPLQAPRTFGEPFKSREEAKVLGVTGVKPAPPLDAPRPADLTESPMTTAMRPQSRRPAVRESRINWSGVSQALQKEAGLTPGEADLQVAGLKEVFDAELLADNGLTDEEAFINAVEAVRGISEAKQLQDLPRYQQTGPNDPLLRAMELQVTEGDPILDLTPEQMTFMKRIITRQQDKFAYEEVDKIASTPVSMTNVSIDGSGTTIMVPTEIVNYLKRTNRNTTSPVFDKQTDDLIRDAMTSELDDPSIPDTPGMRQALLDVRKVENFGDADAWWLDPKRKEAIMADPEAYVDEGWFTDISAFPGATAETTKSWVLRSALGPLNLAAEAIQTNVLEPGVGAVVGAGFEAAEMAGLVPEADYFDPTELTRKRRAQSDKLQPLYEGSPYAAAWALNKGFTGNAMELSEAYNIDGWTKTGMVVGGFFLDLADPTPGFAIGLSKGAKAGMEAYQLQKALLTSTDAGQIARIAGSEGARAFLGDLNGVSALAGKTKKGKAILNSTPGDIRLHFSDEMANSLKAREIAQNAAKRGDADVFDAYEEIQRAGLDNTQYGQRLRNEIDVDTLDNALAKLDNESPPALRPILDEVDELNEVKDSILRYTDDLERDAVKVQEIADITQALPRTLPDVDAIAKARFGKAFTDLTATEALEITDIARHNYARRALFATTKDIPVGDGIVAMTKNTWAHTNTLPALQAEINKTPLGRVIGDITEKSKPGGPVKKVMRKPTQQRSPTGTDVLGERATAPVPKPHYTWSEGTVDVNKIKQQMTNLDIPQRKAALIREGLDRGQISFDDYRLLIDKNTDATAMLLQEEFGVITAGDINKLSDKLQERMLDSSMRRTRGFFGARFDDVVDTLKPLLRVYSKSEAPEIPTTFQQKRLVQEVAQETSTMDVKLQREVEAIINSEEVRVAYLGEEFRNANLTKEEALGAAIVGPRSDKEVMRLFDETGKPVTADEFMARRKELDEDYLNRVSAEKERLAKAKEEKGPAVAEARAKAKEAKRKANEEYEATMEELEARTQTAKQTLKDQAELDKQNHFRTWRAAREKRLAEVQAQAMDTSPQYARTVRETEKQFDDALKSFNKNIDDKLQQKLVELDERFMDVEETARQLKEKTEQLADAGRVQEIQRAREAAKARVVEPAAELQAKASAEAAHQHYSVQKTAEWALDRIYYSNKNRPVYIDRLTGTNQMYGNDLLNAQGLNQLSDALALFAFRAQANPAEFWSHFQDLTKTYEGILSQPKLLNPLLDPAAIRLEREAALQKFRSQTQIGMYYYAEGNRIIDRKLIEATFDDYKSYSVRGYLNGDDYFESAIRGFDPDAVEPVFQNTIKFRLLRQINDPKAVYESFWETNQFLLKSIAKQKGANVEMDLASIINATDEASYLQAVSEVMAGGQHNELIHLASRLSRKAGEAADAILLNNGLQNRLVIDKDMANEIVSGLLGPENSKMNAALLGQDKLDELTRLIGNNRVDPLTAALEELYRTEGTPMRVWTVTKNFFSGTGAFFYFMVLSARPRFHINNVITAPSISYQTSGLTSAKNIVKGRRVAFASPESVLWNDVAVVSPTGKPYTYGELHTALNASGMRSEVSFVTSYVNNDELVGWLGRNKVLGSKSLSWLREYATTKGWTDLTTKEDAMFRASNLITEIQAGKSIEEATSTARISMFDYNEMTATEKSIATTYLVFYSFYRANLMSYLDAMNDVSKMKRFMNILKFDRGVEMSMEAGQQAFEGDPKLKWDPNVFISDYSQSKTLLYKNMVEGKNYSIYYQSPPIPAIDAIATVGALASDPLNEAVAQAGAMLAPGLKTFVYGAFPEAPSGFDKAKKRFPDQLVTPFALYYDDPNDVAGMLSKLAGEEVKPVPVTQGGVRGYIYPISEAGEKSVQKVMSLLSKQGLMAPVTELTNLFGAGPEESAMRQTGEALPGLTGDVGAVMMRSFLNPTKVQSQESQQLYEMYERKRAIEEELRLLRNRTRNLQQEQREDED